MAGLGHVVGGWLTILGGVCSQAAASRLRPLTPTGFADRKALQELSGAGGLQHAADGA